MLVVTERIKPQFSVILVTIRENSMNSKENPHKKYWSTLSEFHQDAEFKKLQKEEFLSKPQGFFDNNGNSDLTFSRRDILKLAGAATVFAAAACARRPVEKIVPYLDPAEEIIPGKAVWYSSEIILRFAYFS